MEMSIKANGRMTKQMDMEFTRIAMGRGMRDTGRMIPKTVMALKLGQTVANTKDSIKMAKNMGMANTNGQMAALTKAAG